MSTPVIPPASVPVLRAMLDQAVRGRWSPGVLGVRAQPRWDGPATFVHSNVPVRVAACVSALAVREALLDADAGGWLVILTDRDDADLGAGLLGHFVWQRLRNPDPWEAVAGRFAASSLSADLVAREHNRDLAIGLLAVTPPEGWTPAPGGVLTAGHAFATAAQRHLDISVDVDATAVYEWSAGPGSVSRLADLRGIGGDALADAMLAWLADRTGPAATPIAAILGSGTITDVLPLGLVAGLASAGSRRDGIEREAAVHLRIRLESRLGGHRCTEQELEAWGRGSDAVIARLDDATAIRLTDRADVLLTELNAKPLAVLSDQLESGLTKRLSLLAGSVLAATSTESGPLAPNKLAAVESALAKTRAHRQAETDSRVICFSAAVRLLRWLATPPGPPPCGMTSMLGRYRDTDGWVDAAYNDVACGVGDAELGAALGGVLRLVAGRRVEHDREFARTLAAHTTAPDQRVRHIEDVLHNVVLTLASATPVLLVVTDGMSVAVATRVMRDLTDNPSQGWLEALLPGETGRAAALAVLPTVTEHSRCSLLSGRLASGQQRAELDGFAAALRLTPGVTGALFHKEALDARRPGLAMADDVGVAVDDTGRYRVVACVLNSIDEALDRSDPTGTVWTADAVKHLTPLLERAARAGRTVILTSDHGHVIERGESKHRSAPDLSSARSRAASGPAPQGDEILVEGTRVLAHDGHAVLAVDEQRRYGPRNAGYRGGASPAEAIVPLCVLVPGDIPEETSLRLAGPQKPSWWNSPLLVSPVEAAEKPVTPSSSQEGLFPAPALVAMPTPASSEVATSVLRSPQFARQRKLAVRGPGDEQMRMLLAALLAAPGHRLPDHAVAEHLSVPVARLRGTLAQVQRMLNVESYPVISRGADGMLELDETLMREQFGV